MNLRSGSWPALLLLWALLLLASLLTHPLLPVDETRYAAVAWEMWQRGDFLVPYLNGEPYSHKPPLYFWLVHAGWWLFDVNEWWPRSVAALVSLAALLATARLAGKLWPEDDETSRLVPWVLFGCIFWTAFYTWVQIDMLLVLCGMLGMTGMVYAARGRGSGWLLTGAAIGLGVLAKGPVILLIILPVALLAPFWTSTDDRRSWPMWYGGVLFSVAIGAVIALAWAVPAGQAGGEDYRQAIFWGQTANRVTHSFAHAHPWWWYLPWLPVLFAPWLLIPWLWGGLTGVLRRPRDMGERFCLVWLASALVLFSIISGKQIKYLLPLLPAFALLTARVLTQGAREGQVRRPRSLAGMMLVTGVFLGVAPFVFKTPLWVADINPAWGFAVMASAVPVAFMKPLPPDRYPVLVAVLSAWVLGVVYLDLFRTAAPAYDLRAVSRLVADAQAAGRPVANLAGYHGQFGFYGRLTEPVESLSPGQVPEWAGRHPDGYLVAYYRGEPDFHPDRVLSQPFRGRQLVVWRGSTISANPELLP